MPIKNRYSYLFKLMEVIDGFHSNEIEIVIQGNNKDNSVIRDCFE